jgi:hypothetical protein
MVTISSRMRWVGHITYIRMSEMRAKFNLEYFKESCYLGDLDFSKDTGCERLDWIQLFGGRGQ